MAMTPEGKVKHAVKKWLTARHIWHFWPVSNGMGRHGIPDAICCVPVVVTPDMVGTTVGLFVGIETKAAGKLGNVSAMQQRQIEDIRASAGIAGAVDSVQMVEQMLGMEP